ncbi:cytochrome P450 monooxygenase-like protein [Pseudomassariella vexata]|uniref:Cytochrome P450 monooxygenase-like protein n=1 Tax=Pseudomassariella vexata TaxID=1141098 RepID=A0A1Y2E798_9PEZI|nr:cytochrome P450 monooxygenase-like protein [Pseudomassariella vexata]ORY67422.1 cytochrome P450 monooxygenase-like protein [Pseudomassariella vexata]
MSENTNTWHFIKLATAAASYALVQYAPNYGVTSSSGYLGTFFTTYGVIFAVWAVYAKFVWPKWLNPLSKLPQPKGVTLLNGHFGQVFNKGFGETEAQWMRDIPNKGFVYYLAQLNQPRLIVTSPTALREIMNRTYEFIKPPGVKLFAAKILGIGLVLSEREQHRIQRRAFLPVFAPKHIRDMYPIFWAKTREVTETFTRLVRGGGERGEATIEVGGWAARTALDVITLTTVGKDFGSVADENSPLSRVYRTVVYPTRAFLVLAILKLYFPVWLIENLPLKWNHYQNEACATIRTICRQLLAEKRQKLSEKSLHDKDVLSVCLQYEEIADVTEEEVIDQMTSLLAAGHETISVGITWAIYMLCVYPEWQTRLREEVRANVPSPSAAVDDDGRGGVTADQVEHMPLMNAFLSETVRRYPPIPLTMRYSTQNTTLDDVIVPEGTLLIVPIKGINRDERFWGPDADKFRPERWLSAENGNYLSTGGVSNKYGNLSFLQGARSCVAQNFSRAEMACIISAWVGRFKFELVDKRLMDENNMEVSNGNLSGKPLHGLDVKLRIVEGW